MYGYSDDLFIRHWCDFLDIARARGLQPDGLVFKVVAKHADGRAREILVGLSGQALKRGYRVEGTDWMDRLCRDFAHNLFE